MKARAEVLFFGSVQQVFFRDYTRRFAHEHEVTGWVMNLHDGSVRAVFEGEWADIDEVIRKLREEHPRARVDRVDIRWSRPKNEFHGFEIRYG